MIRNDNAIIIPAYNEERTIELVIQDFHRELPDAYYGVVDNNSDDNTASIARKTLKTFHAKGVVFKEARQGKGNAIRKAFSEIDADVYVMVDADATYCASDIHSLLQPIIEGKADMVIGDRLSNGLYRQKNKRLFHNFGNNLVKKIINIVFHANLHDIMTGYRAFNRKFVKNYPILVEGFELETAMTLHALDKKFMIQEIPIQYNDRPIGSFSKLNTVSDGFRVIKTIFKILKDYRPLSFFGYFALFFLLAGLLVGTPVIIEFMQTRYILHVPLAILATGLVIMSLLALSIGLILDTIVEHQRMDYELLLNQYHYEKR